MGYDLMVFAPEAAPEGREAFIGWFHKITKWVKNTTTTIPHAHRLLAQPQTRHAFRWTQRGHLKASDR